MADTAALVVALSAQLTKFEKDMKSAVDIADKRTREIEGVFGQMNKGIENQLNSLAGNFNSRFGVVGSALSALGPVGSTVAAILGVVTLGFAAASRTAQEFAEKSKAIREAADTAGLTINEFKSLAAAGARVGLDMEQSENAVNRLAVGINELREKGTGPLYDSLLKIDRELPLQVAQAKNTSAAIDIIANAYASLDDAIKKAGFSADVFGRRNIRGGRVLEELAGGGGIDALVAKSKQAGTVLDEEINKRVVDLQREIKKLNADTDRMWGEALSPGNLETTKKMAELWNAIARAITQSADKAREIPAATSEAASGAFDTTQHLRPGAPAERGMTSQLEQETEAMDRASEATRELMRSRKEWENEEQKATAALRDQLAALQRWTSIGSQAVTAAEEFRKKQLELRFAVDQNRITQEQANREEAALLLQQRQTAEALRERLAIATEEQIVQSKLEQAKAEAIKTGQAAIDLTNYEILVRKQAKETVEAQTASLSKLTETTRQGQQFTNAFKQIDQAIVSFGSNFESAVADIAVGSQTMAQAFKSLADSIIRDLVRMTIRMSITGPLFKALGGLFGGIGGGGSLAGAQDAGWFAGLNTGGFIPQRQGGGPVTAGRGYIVGEHGPEYFVPKTSGQIVPGGVSKGGTSGGGYKVTINNYAGGTTEATAQQQQGPNGTELIIGIVRKTLASGDADLAQRARFGLRPNKVR